jgi:large subunit ribosomal protein L31
MNKLNLSDKEKKEQGNQKKRSKSLPVHTITYSCVCGAKFETLSTFKHNLSTSGCSQCNPFYTGVPAQEVRVGAVARFREKFGSKKTS